MVCVEAFRVYCPSVTAVGGIAVAMELVMSRHLRALRGGSFGEREARHLLNRAGFGGPPQEVSKLATMGLEEAVDSLVDFHNTPMLPVREDEFDKDIVRPTNEEERAEIRRARERGDEAAIDRFRREIQARQRSDRRQMAAIQEWWMQRMIQTPRPLEEKLTLFWHGHFATNYRGTQDSYHMFMQNQLFRANAAGNFADLCFGIIRDPAMLRYLNNDRNRRQAPNENLARELMELFTLGEGNMYTEQDIREGARALTGYTFYDDDFVFREHWHDPQPKTIFGRTGNFDGDDFVRLILSQPIVSEFICMKLYRFFVNDQPEPLPGDAQQFVVALAGELRKNEYQLRPVLKTLFKSQHFYDQRHRAGLIKSPVQLIVQLLRALELTPGELMPWVRTAGTMGQMVFYPPSVKGWDVGRTWINTSTLFARQNAVIRLLHQHPPDEGRRPRRGRRNRRGARSRYNTMDLVESPSTPGEDVDPINAEQVARRLLSALLCIEAQPEHIETVTGLFRKHHDVVNEQTVRGAIILIAAMPEYQLC